MNAYSFFLEMANLVEGNASSVFTAVAPVAGTILAAVVGWGLFKRFIR